MQCSLVFEQQPSTYTTDRSKITYIMGLLLGNALALATAVWDNLPLVSSSYPVFVSEIKKVFDHPVRGRDAANRLLCITQGSRSVAEYSVEFRIIAAESGWNDVSTVANLVTFSPPAPFGQKGELTSKCGSSGG